MKLWLFLGLEELELLSNVNITDDILYEGEKIMKWNQFRLKTTTEAEDIVSSMLADLGIEGDPAYTAGQRADVCGYITRYSGR